MEITPELPIPISLIRGQYLLFSVDAVTYLRREYHICGVLIGSLPHVPQQNVFLGLPLMLMPEEARLLVEKGVAYIFDDAAAHQQGLANASMQKRRQYVKMLREAGRQAAASQAEAKERVKAQALRKSRSKIAAESVVNVASEDEDEVTRTTEVAREGLLFAPSTPPEPATSNSFSISTFGITPATSASLLKPPPPPVKSSDDNLPPVPDSYPLFKHLHSKGHFTFPGLRFGCQYLVYPGDQLRFHSHFLASHVGWDEELDLMDLVGGGRLGTGVKKGYLIGGLEKKKWEQEDGHAGEEKVRTFSIEWASM